MPVFAKPPRQTVSLGNTDPWWRWAWNDLKLALPLWEGAGDPLDYRTSPLNAARDKLLAKDAGVDWGPSESGLGLYFDGSEKVQVTATALANSVNAFPITVLCVATVWSDTVSVVWSRAQSTIDTRFWELHSNPSDDSWAWTLRQEQGGITTADARTASSAVYGSQQVVVGRSSSSSNHALFVDGLLSDTDTTDITNQTMDNEWIGGLGRLTPAYTDDATVSLVLVWDRALSDNEIRIVSSDPFGMFYPDFGPETWTPKADTVNRTNIIFVAAD